MSAPFRPQDLYRLRWVGELALAPDDRIAYSVYRLDEENDTARCQLWLFDGARHYEATFDGIAGAPVFSPDGRYLAYRMSTADSPSKLYVLPLDGGAPRCLSGDLEAVAELRWLPDSSGLVFSAVEPEQKDDDKATAERESRRPRRLRTIRYRFNGRGWIDRLVRQIFLVQLPTAGETASPRKLTDATVDSWCPAIDPTGERLAFLSARHENAGFVGGNDVFAVDLADQPRAGDATRLTSTGAWDHVAYTPDGERLALLGHHERMKVTLSRLYLLDATGGTPERRDHGDDAAIHGHSLPELALEFTADDGALVAVPRRGAGHVDRIDLATGERTTILDGRRTIRCFATHDYRERIVFTASEPVSPGELFEWRGGEERQLTSVGGDVTRHFVMPESVEVESRDGTRVEAFVYRPPEAARGDRPTPGLVWVHGGPKTQYGWSFLDELQLLAHAGWTVIGGNPRGSDGYGDAFARAVVGRLGEGDWQDIQAITEHLAELPGVDPECIGIGGGSYGGFMTSWAIGHTDRYQAALVERAVTNWETMQGTSDIGGFFVELYTGANTMTDVESLRRQSPIHHASAVTTPTLILHSEEDWRCPPEQSEQLFVALKMAGVDVELVRFPEANHDLSRAGRPAQRIERFEIILDFFRRHLSG